MAPLDQSAGHALARDKRALSGWHRNRPAATITHQAVAAYTYATTLRLLGAVVPQHLVSLVGLQDRWRGEKFKYLIHLHAYLIHYTPTCLSPRRPRVPGLLFPSFPQCHPGAIPGSEQQQGDFCVLFLNSLAKRLPLQGSQEGIKKRAWLSRLPN